MKNKSYVLLMVVMMIMIPVGCGRTANNINNVSSVLEDDSRLNTSDDVSDSEDVDTDEANLKSASSTGESNNRKKSSSFKNILNKLKSITGNEKLDSATENNKDSEEDVNRASGNKNTMEFNDSDALDGDSITQKKPEDSIGINVATQDGHSSSDLSNYKDDYVEFVSYSDQQITSSSGMVLTNLSTNTGIKMIFTISENGKVLKKSDAVEAGKDWIVTSKDLGLKDGEHNVSILSQAFTEDDVALNCVEQTIRLTIASIVTKTSTDYYKCDNQSNGTKYETAVYYNADNTEFSAIVPAVVGIEKDDIGTDIYVSFRALNAKKGMTATVAAANTGNNKAKINLAGDNETVTAVLSSEQNGTASLKYTFDKVYSGLQQVGPIHCNVAKGKTARQSYYGTCKFNVKLTGAKTGGN